LFVSSGNHDWAPTRLEDLAYTLFLRSKNSNVRSDGADEVLNGYRFICSAWGDILEPVESANPVIILTHTPPAKTLLARSGAGDLGEPVLRDVALKLPRGSLILCGHIHQPEGWAERIGDAWCFNPGYPASGGAIPNHISFDLEQGTAKFVGEPTWETEQSLVVDLRG
jgi:hypothetical protein